MALYALRYPNTGSPTYSYSPSVEPIVGLSDPPDFGIMQQRAGDGESQTYIVHPVRERFIRPCAQLSATDIANRLAFFSNTRGLPIGMRDELSDPTYRDVKWTAVSAPVSMGGGFWACVDEFEETTSVPSLADLGDVRVGYVDFTGSEVDKTATFSPGPYADPNYIPHLTPAQSTPSGELIAAFVKSGSLLDASFDILLAAAPGAGNTVRVYYETLHL